MGLESSGWTWEQRVAVPGGKCVTGIGDKRLFNICSQSGCLGSGVLVGSTEQHPRALLAAAFPGTVYQITSSLQPDIKNMKQLGFFFA